MKVLTGLLYPTNGDFSLFGKNKPCDILKMRRHIGSTIEAPALYPEYSAYRNLELQRMGDRLDYPPPVDNIIISGKQIKLIKDMT